MNTLVVYLCSSTCLFIYIPVVWLGIQQVMHQKATLNVRMRRYLFTGTAAIFFGLGQTLGGVVSIIGVMLAIQNYNLLYIPLFIGLGALVSMGGLWLARKVATEDQMVDMTPSIDLTSFIMRNVNFQQGQPQTDDNFISPDDDDVITLSPDDVTVIDDDDDKR